LPHTDGHSDRVTKESNNLLTTVSTNLLSVINHS